MKKLILLCILLLFISCDIEWSKIPEAPYIITQTKICTGCKANYKYWIRSMNSINRTDEIITNQLFNVGDTIYLIKK